MCGRPRRRSSRPSRLAYRFLTSVVVPRPIAWISTITPDGRTGNLAPHSFFSIAGTDPPIVRFTSTGRKDPLRNVEDTGELRPLTKLGGDEWGTLGEVLHLNRIPCEEPGTPHDQP
ncbi:hypothetical protein [Streptomyces sp. NPDC086519]|uniref:hypothetical protein n=1 Tax=Streptomyces sp. NPDC086519 TaxID=3154863 RepID=UPI0034292295